MKDFLEKLQEFAARIEADRGPLALLGIFLREDAPDYWDLIVSSDWLDGGGLEQLQQVATILSEVLGEQEILELSRIVPMDTSSDDVRRFVSWAVSQTTPFSVSSFSFAGARIQTAYIIVAREQNHAAHMIAH